MVTKWNADGIEHVNGNYVGSEDYDALEKERDELRKKTACTIGVGYGDGGMFVHGDYDSVRRVREIIADGERARKELVEAESEIERLRSVRSEMAEIAGDRDNEIERLHRCAQEAIISLDMAKGRASVDAAVIRHGKKLREDMQRKVEKSHDSRRRALLELRQLRSILNEAEKLTCPECGGCGMVSDMGAANGCQMCNGLGRLSFAGYNREIAARAVESMTEHYGRFGLPHMNWTKACGSYATKIRNGDIEL